MGVDEVGVTFSQVIEHKIYEERNYTLHNNKREGEWLVCTHHIFRYLEPRNHKAVSDAYD